MSEKVTRLEVIDHTTNGVGRILVRYHVSVELAYQDDGRTLKVFVKDIARPEDSDYRDPILDAWPQLGPVTPCGLCGSGLPQRHRVIDAIVDAYCAGEDSATIASDLALPLGAVEAVRLVIWGGSPLPNA